MTARPPTWTEPNDDADRAAGEHGGPKGGNRSDGEDVDDDQNESEEDDDEDEEEEEPKLKYSRLTDTLTGVYRNGDATSTFVVSGDKLV